MNEDFPFVQTGLHNHAVASLHALFGQNDKAFEKLNEGIEYLEENLEGFFRNPDFKNLYDDPRWDSLLTRLGDEFNYDLKMAVNVEFLIHY